LVPLLYSNTSDARDIYSGWMMDETPKKIYQTNLHQKQTKVKPKEGWKDDAENDRREMAICNRRQAVQDRDG